MTGIIDVGGGMRGIYSSGILDYCLQKDINFDLCIGISAGSANMASYLSRQEGRGRRFYCDYSFRENYMSMDNLLKTGSYINFDYIYDDISGSKGEDPLDYETMMSNKGDFIVIATNAETGRPRYFRKSEIKKDSYDIFKASCCIPGINKPIIIDGVPYYDGALSDTIPVKKAFSEGCDKVVLILSKPIDTVRKVGKDAVLAKMIEGEYPKAARKFLRRAERYNLYVKLARQMQAEGRLLILAPSDITGVDTLKRDREALEALYERGYNDAPLIEEFLK